MTSQRDRARIKVENGGFFHSGKLVVYEIVFHVWLDGGWLHWFAVGKFSKRRPPVNVFFILIIIRVCRTQK